MVEATIRLRVRNNHRRGHSLQETETADYSVAITAGLSYNGDIHLLDIMRAKYDFPELKRALIALNARWRGNGLRGVHIEDKASGQSLIQELRNESGIAVIPRKVVNDKVARVNAVTDLIEGGRVFLPKEAHWLDDFYRMRGVSRRRTRRPGRHPLIVLDVLSRVPRPATHSTVHSTFPTASTKRSRCSAPLLPTWLPQTSGHGKAGVCRTTAYRQPP